MQSRKFEVGNYGAALEPLLRRTSRCDLGPGQPNHAAQDELQALTLERAFAGHRIVDRNMARACLAGVWLYHDFLDESHHISQEVETPTGSYWHGIMHRREPDYSNAKYWFRRVGRHEIFAPLVQAARTIIADTDMTELSGLTAAADWDALKFVDACEAASHSRKGLRECCETIQQAEWELLFDYCYRAAIGD